MKLSSSWLPSDQGPPAEVAGVFVPTWSAFENAPFPTRRSEFRWAAHQLEKLKRGVVLDAGAGFNQEIHVMPYIAGNLGFDVMAVDAEVVALNMAHHPRVLRFCGDLCDLPFPDASYDVWLCVSVLEHMAMPEKQAALKEAFRLLKAGGVALVTTDETEPSQVEKWLFEAGFETGPVDSGRPKAPLSPAVAVAIARKP